MKFYRQAKFIRGVVVLLVLILSSACQKGAPNYSLDLRGRVHQFTLDNGMTVLLLKRLGAPVFSAQITTKVGNAEEVEGSRGLAHFFEHMAFKGTDQISTKDYKKEKAILDKIFEIGTKIVELKKQGGDLAEIQALETKRKELEELEKQYILKNEFVKLYQMNGGVNINATTSNDFTRYYVSLPANKLELWAYMESSRFKNPVMREFFTEKDVVAEERRTRIDNTPSGQIYEAYMNLAFDKSPYKVVVLGPAEDIQNYTPAVARAFYEKYYIPSRITVAVVGNIDIQETEKVIRKYFGTIPAKEDTGQTFKGETFDLKTFPREKTLKGPEKPRFYLGYHRPTHPNPDDIVMDVIREILCSGRTSRLYKKLVLEDKKAAGVACYASIPGSRLDTLFTFHGLPHDGHTNQDIKTEIKKELAKLAKEGPTPMELQRVKNNIDADLIYSLQSNSGLASQLTYYQSLTGSWEYVYELQDRIHKMTAEDVKRVVNTYFVPSHEVTVFYEQENS